VVATLPLMNPLPPQHAPLPFSSSSSSSLVLGVAILGVVADLLFPPDLCLLVVHQADGLHAVLLKHLQRQAAVDLDTGWFA
jgi:hypothetical protein